MLDHRTLNRGLLARQLLLDRADHPVAATVEHLVGLHAQIPNDPYVALWARLADFHPLDLIKLIVDRRAVRVALHRSTIHLVTATDCLGLRPLVQTVLDRDLYTNATHSVPLRGLDLEALIETALPLLRAEPRTPSELGSLLHLRFRDLSPAALAYAVRNLVPLVQVPPRGVWRSSGAPRHTPAEHWLGDAKTPTPHIEDLIVRYLGAFGPASVADVQTWSGLTRLSEPMSRLEGELLAFQDDNGRTLFDLPSAPRPDPETPASPRLLPQYDNVFLAHADRRRIIPSGRSFAQHSAQFRLRRRQASWLRGNLLLDGYLNGEWSITRADGEVTIGVRPFRPVTAEEESDLHDEAARLLAAVTPEPSAEVRTIRIDPLETPPL